MKTFLKVKARSDFSSSVKVIFPSPIICTCKNYVDQGWWSLRRAETRSNKIVTISSVNQIKLTQTCSVELILFSRKYFPS